MSYFGRSTGLLSGSNRLKDIRATPGGEIGVELGGANVSAFGDLITAENTPLFQYDFVSPGTSSTFNTQIMSGTVANGGTVTVSNSRLTLQTGTNTAGSAIHQSVKVARYRAGQGNTARFTAAFTTGAANSTQIAGMANVGNAVSGSSAIDGYFFGYNGAAFGIRHINAFGSDTWTAQTSWNVDKLDGTKSLDNPSGYTLDPTKGNIYQIRYPYLGYGDIKFFVQNPLSGLWMLVHVIQYAGSTNVIQLSNPGLNFFAQAINSGNNTNLTVYLGSVSVMLSGVRTFTGPQYAADAILASLGTSEVPILSLRCCASMNGVSNRGMVRLRSLSLTSDGGNGITRVRLRKLQATNLTGASFSPIAGSSTDGGITLTAAQSIVSVDTTASALAGSPAASTVVYNAGLARNSNVEIDLTQYDIYLVPGDIFTFGAVANAGTPTVTVSVNWQEDA